MDLTVRLNFTDDFDTRSGCDIFANIDDTLEIFSVLLQMGLSVRKIEPCFCSLATTNRCHYDLIS